MSSGERRGGNPPKVSNPMTGQAAPSRSMTRGRNMVVPPLNMPNSATTPDRPSRAALTRHWYRWTSELG